jgi:hypothetical protein
MGIGKEHRVITVKPEPLQVPAREPRRDAPPPAREPQPQPIREPEPIREPQEAAR